MIKLFFLLPILMSLIWWWYLDNRGYSLKEGLKGFIYIALFNSVIIGFFTLMIFVTSS
ncbi:hypothetical protein KO495_13525 [Colwellia sp. D2M02]|uniref:Uncharacterized protein n=1 Tax=Colwellia asteriadis TaxID=517723 RepID=A0ABN1LC72_9GAMM|nr:hypothetical protein [Colwellia sp. D2M02]MBU2894329.1 hypothetical protein [Colwellia sp. D2M02]